MTEQTVEFLKKSPVVAFLLLVFAILMTSCFCLATIIASYPYLPKGTL